MQDRRARESRTLLEVRRLECRDKFWRAEKVAQNLRTRPNLLTWEALICVNQEWVYVSEVQVAYEECES